MAQLKAGSTAGGNTIVTQDANGRIGVGGGVPSGADLQFDNSFDATAGTASKIRLYDYGDIYGFGVSSAQLDYLSGDKHVFYNQTDDMVSMEGDGEFCSLNVHGPGTTGGGAVLFAGSHGSLELGGPSGAYIDLKAPFSDDYDTRIECNGPDFYITNTRGTSFYRSVNGIDITANHNSGTNANIVLEANNGQIYFNSWIASSAGPIYFNGCGSRGATGNVVTTPNDSIANALRSSGYIEWITDAGAIGTTYFNSDARLKENIAPASIEALPLFDQIEYKQFNWKEEAGRDCAFEKLGFIAQDMQVIEPSWVNELSDGTLSMSDTQLISYCMKAISELSAKNKELEARLAKLETN